jgi:hypothetical protein
MNVIGALRHRGIIHIILPLRLGYAGRPILIFQRIAANDANVGKARQTIRREAMNAVRSRAIEIIFSRIRKNIWVCLTFS